jgi:hypothetical protein
MTIAPSLRGPPPYTATMPGVVGCQATRSCHSLPAGKSRPAAAGAPGYSRTMANNSTRSPTPALAALAVQPAVPRTAPATTSAYPAQGRTRGSVPLSPLLSSLRPADSIFLGAVQSGMDDQSPENRIEHNVFGRALNPAAKTGPMSDALRPRRNRPGRGRTARAHLLPWPGGGTTS